MYKVQIHKHAQKALKKRALICLIHLQKNGTKDFPYPLTVLKGYRQFKYIEAKIDKDYKIVFRIKNKAIYIRYAGTHNALGTG